MIHELELEEASVCLWDRRPLSDPIAPHGLRPDRECQELMM